MTIKMIRTVTQENKTFVTGETYQVETVTISPRYYEVVNNDKPVKTEAKRKRQATAVMKPSEIRKVVMRNK